MRRLLLGGSMLMLLAGAAPAPQATLEQKAPFSTLAILGESVVDQDGKVLGRLIDVLVDEQGAPQAAAIDFGGFIGIGSRKIVVPWTALRFAPQLSKAPIMLELTPEQIKAAPEYKGSATPIPKPAAKPTSAPASGS